MSRPTDEQLQKLGASLREIDPTALAIDEEDGAAVRWFLGENATELFAWIHAPNPPHHIQLVFARVSAQWDSEKGLATGQFDGAPSTAGGRYDPYILNLGDQADADVCRAALVLLSANPVAFELCAPMVNALKEVLGDGSGSPA